MMRRELRQIRNLTARTREVHTRSAQGSKCAAWESTAGAPSPLFYTPKGSAAIWGRAKSKTRDAWPIRQNTVKNGVSASAARK